MSNIVALHGFLGKPSDWQIFTELSIMPIDLFSFSQRCLSLDAFGLKLNEGILGKNILMGYSMGGRLAMHALLKDQSKWQAAVIISAHTGLSLKGQREERLKNDATLLKHFQEDFERAFNKWEQQPLFGGKNSCLRKKEHYSPHDLAQSLKFWSLGNQEDLKSKIQALTIPILWIAGERDEKYAKLAAEMQFSHPKSKIWIAPNSFHRVAWEQQKACEKNIKEFLEGL